MAEQLRPEVHWDLWLIRLLVVVSFTFSLLPPNLEWTEVSADTNFTAGNLALQLEFGAVFLGGAWLAWRHADWTRYRLRFCNPLLIAFVAWCAITVLWSTFPVVTIKRVVQLSGFLLVGIAVGPPVGGSRQLLRLLMATLTALLVASMVTVFVNPRIGIDYELGGAWRGLMSQKNTTGAIAGMCSLLWLRETVDGRTLSRWTCLAGLLFCLFMLVMAKSSTSIMVTGIGAGLYILLRRHYVTMRHPWWVIGLVGAALLLLAVHIFVVFTGHLPGWDDIAGGIGSLFGKSSDLTGRTEIWQLVMLEVARHPLLGIGYGGFWLGEGSPSQYVIDAMYWIPLQSHNGYLDLLNELGIVGLVLALLAFVWHGRSLSKLMRFDREEAAMHCAIFAMLLVSNVTESEIFRGMQFYNILFFYSVGAVTSQVAMYSRGRVGGAPGASTNGTPTGTSAAGAA
ncbi:MAG: O-antigen ligase family protein [Pseudomonadota bacterium]